MQITNKQAPPICKKPNLNGQTVSLFIFSAQMAKYFKGAPFYLFIVKKETRREILGFVQGAPSSCYPIELLCFSFSFCFESLMFFKG